VSGKSFTPATEREFFLILFWSVMFDYSKGMMLLLSSKFYASAFAQWRPLIEAFIRSHLVLMVSDEDFERIRKDNYRVNFKEDAKTIDQFFGLGRILSSIKNQSLPRTCSKSFQPVSSVISMTMSGFWFCAVLGITPPAIMKLETASTPSVSFVKPSPKFIFSSPYVVNLSKVITSP
jgi:hypothetical protein